MNIGSISPDAAAAKRSQLEVGPQLRFRVCDSVFDIFGAKMLVEALFWNITASCTTMYTAHQTKMRPDDFSDATNAILPSYASLQCRDINIVHLLLWLWRKQQIRDKGIIKWIMLSGKPAILCVGSFARATGACIFRCEKDLH